MKRRTWCVILGVVVLAGLLFSAIVWRQSASRSHILLITLDTTRADRLGCYGATQARTPTLDALAARGLLYERAYAPIPVTLPSHASMLTGLWPPEHGLITNGQSSLVPEIPTAAEILAEHGYSTAAFVAAFVLQEKFGLSRGFELYDDDLSTADIRTDELHRNRDGRLVVDSAIEWLSLHHRLTTPRPFFCWVHLYDPHDPYIEHPDDFGSDFSDRRYDGEIAYVDLQIGRLLDALEEQGIADDTTVIVVGDHGESLGEHGEETHGYMLHDSTLRVPLIIAGPRSEDSSGRIAAPVPLIDVFATLLEIGGVDKTEGSSSHSLLPALEGTEIEKRFCYSQTDEPYLQAYWSPLRGLTNDRWRYVRTSKPELYDLVSDPGELDNLAGQYPEMIQKFEDELKAFEKTLKIHKAVELSISPEERRTLESLGYIGGRHPDKPSTQSDTLLPDIKDMIGHLNEVNHATDLIEEQKFDEAMILLKPLAQGVPNFFRARLNLGHCYMRQQNYEEGVIWFKAALEIDPNSERAHDMLGYCYLRLGKLELSMKHFLTVLNLRPDSETAHLFVGEINQRQGNLVLARRHYETVLQINPRNESARRVLEQLSK